MKNKNLGLKLVALLFACGSFGVISNSAYAMDAGDKSNFVSDKFTPDKVDSFELTSKPSVNEVDSTDFSLKQEDKETLEKLDWLSEHMLPMVGSDEVLLPPRGNSLKFENNTAFGKEMASKFEKVLSFLHFLVGDKYKYCENFDPKLIGKEPLSGKTAEDLKEIRSSLKKNYRDELIKDFDQINRYLRNQYVWAVSAEERGAQGVVDVFKKDLYWFQDELVKCLWDFKDGGKFSDAIKLNVANKDMSMSKFWNFALDKDILKRVITFAKICDEVYGEHSLFRYYFKQGPEEVLKAIIKK